MCSQLYGFGQTKPAPENSKNQSKPQIEFIAHPYQKYGFDALENEEWQDQYHSFKSKKTFPVYASYKSVKYRETDHVLIAFSGIRSKINSNLKISVGEQNISFTKFDDSSFVIELPIKRSDYVVKAFWKNEVVAKLFVQVQKQINEKIVIVPLVPIHFSEYEIRQKLNSIYRQSTLQFDVKLDELFKSKVFEPATIFSSPVENHIEYTGQMRLLRDIYFEQHPKTDKNAYYIFIIQGFKDSLLNGFMVKNKSIAFSCVSDSLDLFSNQLAKTLGFGIGALDDSWTNNGPEKGTSKNLMDTSNLSHLTHIQWNRLRKTPNYYSIYDNEENIRTNNGTVAYYFWKEDERGNIILNNHRILESIKRPYKHNYLSYRFKVKYFILRPFWKIGDYYISILNVLFLVIILLILWFTRRKLKHFWERKKWRFKFVRRFFFFIIFCFVLFQVSENYWITNRILKYFKQISGPLTELSNLEYGQARKEILTNDKLLHEEVSSVCSEILVWKKGRWYIKKRSKVLYFDMKKNTKGKWSKAILVSSSDSINLSTLNYHKKANGHYLVVNFKKTDGRIEKQKLYNYLGDDISSKFENENPPKRILVFVNGYRPTSIGQTFEENFIDVQNNGIEFQNSKNYIYDFDRFDYWRPWNDINSLFQKRLNPNETYYADGHFSVETSNYRSMINFSSISSLYPKRCSNPSKHTCHKIQNATWKQFILNNSKTISQLKMRPNRKGFNLRKYKGRIAGKNLLQILNDIPDYSKNDTLYVVAHSMGFAYSQGIIEELRGKINFGGYYIIAPENGKSGKVKISEWKEVWQYGSNLNQNRSDAPCLQDGIAPQCKIPGLSNNKRVFIPKKLYRCKGFYDSHFIGYYTWIFNIQKDKAGYISNN